MHQCPNHAGERERELNTNVVVCRATAGYHSARMFRTLRGNSWKKAATLVSVLLLPISNDGTTTNNDNRL